jgi:hypothetical protein
MGGRPDLELGSVKPLKSIFLHLLSTGWVKRCHGLCPLRPATKAVVLMQHVADITLNGIEGLAVSKESGLEQIVLIQLW